VVKSVLDSESPAQFHHKERLLDVDRVMILMEFDGNYGGFMDFHGDFMAKW